LKLLKLSQQKMAKTHFPIYTAAEFYIKKLMVIYSLPFFTDDQIWQRALLNDWQIAGSYICSNR
jgi:hypothetical protein